MRLLDARRAAPLFCRGTGIAPVRAILQAHLAANPDADARLFFGARRAQDLFYRDEFEALAERRPNFVFHPTVSGEDPHWRGRRGRVSAHLEEALQGRGSRDAYFCGPREMVERLKIDLAAAGIPTSGSPTSDTEYAGCFPFQRGARSGKPQAAQKRY